MDYCFWRNFEIYVDVDVDLYICRDACVHAKLIQLCLTLCDLMNCSPPGSSVHGILQARILEWVAFSSSRESFRPRDWIHISWISCTGKQILSPLSHLESPLREWVGNICIGWIIMIYLITKWDQRRLSPYSLSFAFILLFLHFPS